MRILCVVAMLLMFATARGVAEEPVKAPEKTPEKATILDRAAKAAEVVKVKTEEFKETVDEKLSLIIETSENIEETATAIKEIGWLQKMARGEGTAATIAKIFLVILTILTILAVTVRKVLKKPNQRAP